jgi:C4-dicarboxylate-specific signal transduction histidine kinase
MQRKQETDYERARKKAVESSRESTTVIKELSKLTKKINRQKRQGQTLTDQDIDSLLRVSTDLQTKVNEADKAQKELVKAAEIRQSELINQKDTLGNLASLGILTACFGHEILGASNVAATTSIELKDDLLRGLFMVSPDVKQDVENSLESIIYSTGKIETFAKFTLRNVRRDKRSRKEVSLNNIITQVFQYFKEPLNEKNIVVELNLQDRLPKIDAFPIDWESIVVNFITNSVWAMEDKAAEDRMIRVRTQEKNGIINLCFADTGIGIEEGTHDRIFLPTFSTRRNENGEIIGTGMGLAIVKGFVEAYPGGKIEVISPGELGGAQFNISVRSMNIPAEEKPNGSENNMAN